MNNKEKILRISRDLFLKYGYNGISIRTIAAKAKLTTGAIYFHFKNKKEIYKTICIEAIDILLSMFRKGVRARDTIPRKLISTYDAYLDFYYTHQDYYNILMEFRAEYDSSDNEAREEIINRMKDLLVIMSQTVQEGIDRGDFRETDPLMLALFLAIIPEGMLQFKKLGLLSALNINDQIFRKFMISIIGPGIEKNR